MILMHFGVFSVFLCLLRRWWKIVWKKCILKKICILRFFVFFMFLLFLLLISVAQNLRDIFIAVGIPAGSTLLVFLKSITEKGNVLVEGKLKAMMSWKRYKHLWGFPTENGPFSMTEEATWRASCRWKNFSDSIELFI